MATKTQVYNLALSRIGLVANITAGDNSEADEHLELIYDTARDKALASYNWRFARRILPLTRRSLTISGVSLGATTTITATAHGFLDGQKVCIEDIVGTTELNGSTYRIGSATTNDFEILDPTTGAAVDSSAFTAYTSGGVGYKVSADGWAYSYVKPTDAMAVRAISTGQREKTDPIPFDLENHNDTLEDIVTDEENAHAIYTSNSPTEAVWSQDFVSALSFLLASELALSITKSREMRAEQYQLYQEEIASAWAATERSRQRDPRRDTPSVAART